MTASRGPLELLVVANGEFARRLRLIGLDDWRRPTPCSEWDVRALVNHVIGGCVHHQMLLRGAQTQVVEATRVVDRTGRELLSMRILDSAVHGWDLARAIGADEALDDEVVAFLIGYPAGLDLGAPADADAPRNASSQDRLLHRLGRRPNVTEEVP